MTSTLPDDGTGTVQVWRIKGFELEEVPPKSHGVFYSGDCYVILYTYLKNNREKHIIYFWLVSVISLDYFARRKGCLVRVRLEMDGRERDQLQAAEVNRAANVTREVNVTRPAKVTCAGNVTRAASVTRAADVTCAVSVTCAGWRAK